MKQLKYIQAVRQCTLKKKTTLTLTIFFKVMSVHKMEDECYFFRFIDDEPFKWKYMFKAIN